jgi:hypothetical protein
MKAKRGTTSMPRYLGGRRHESSRQEKAYRKWGFWKGVNAAGGLPSPARKTTTHIGLWRDIDAARVETSSFDASSLIVQT